MKMHCEKEEQVVRARAEGLQEGDAGTNVDGRAELLRHVAACAVCQEALFIAGLFQDEQGALHAQARPPEAELVWWKAQLRARREAVVRAEAPVVIAEKAAWIAGALSTVALAVWQWPAIRVGLALSSASPNSGAHLGAWLAPLAASLAGTVVLAGVSLYLMGSEK